MRSGEKPLFVEATYLYIRAIAVEAHPALICDLCNLWQVVIFKLIQADVMGQPGWRGGSGWEAPEGEDEEKKKINVNPSALIHSQSTS